MIDKITYVEPSVACDPGNLRRHERRPCKSSKIWEIPPLRKERRRSARNGTCSAPVSFKGRLFTKAFVNLVTIRLTNKHDHRLQNRHKQCKLTLQPCRKSFSSTSSVRCDHAQWPRRFRRPEQARQYTPTRRLRARVLSTRYAASRVRGYQQRTRVRAGGQGWRQK